MPRSIVTLTTDFGDADGFVGTMKGVILTIARRASIDVELVDLAHAISPGDVRHAALVLAAAAPYFPPATIHLVVVDPGVGTSRAAIAIATEHGFLVGPDNGVLSLAAGPAGKRRVHRLESAQHRLDPTSDTFHGRDVFAPAAAHLACGVAIEALGPPHPAPIELALPRPAVGADRITGEVIYVDRFGNLTTNVDRALLARFFAGAVSVTIAGTRIDSVSRAYGVTPAAPLVAVVNSWGWLEVACPGGSAAARLGAGRGTEVVLERPGPRPIPH
ncbi:MAG TPA: SAM-dependent chlorinase/fluorinase [Candidatus Bathyarchaeia archaeon]|nr:SAM-dependent chlorinase/fluorinase [Candidatus Bathyarchaeia archaeon]